METVHYIDTRVALKLTLTYIVIPHGFTPGDVIWSENLAAELPIACFSDRKI